jgi:hypothetical protein
MTFSSKYVYPLVLLACALSKSSRSRGLLFYDTKSFVYFSKSHIKRDPFGHLRHLGAIFVYQFVF